MNQIVNANDVIGVDVENNRQESLGSIKGLMLDKQSGKVSYVVLSFGGFMGMGDKYFAMPWSIFSYNPSRDCFIISKSKEELKNSPGFDKDNWPNMSDKSWQNSMTQHWGVM